MYASTLNRLLITMLSVAVIAAAGVVTSDPLYLVPISGSIYLGLVATLYKLDYLHPSVAFVLPWTMILIFSVIPISIHARPLGSDTYLILLASIFAWLLGCAVAPPAGAQGSTRSKSPDPSSELSPLGRHVARYTFFAFAGLYAFAVVNVLAAGYIPLVSLLTTGDSHYLDFGIHSVYGAFLAYANASACVAWYVYLRSRRRIFFVLVMSVLVMHIVLITRQNIITLFVEMFVVRCLTLRRLSGTAIVACVVGALVTFSLLGTLRSGNVRDLFGVRDEFNWLPTSFVWLYAYSYFNTLNVDNAIAFSGAPFFDGYMWQTLLPSIVRPENTHAAYIEVEGAATTSYIYPVYIDIGQGVILWTGVLSVVTGYLYRRAIQYRRFLDIAAYSCLFFCALLSFFVDFWLYLPVIFQVFFFWVFQRLMFDPTGQRRIVDA